MAVLLFLTGLRLGEWLSEKCGIWLGNNIINKGWILINYLLNKYKYFWYYFSIIFCVVTRVTTESLWMESWCLETQSASAMETVIFHWKNQCVMQWYVIFNNFFKCCKFSTINAFFIKWFLNELKFFSPLLDSFFPYW